jgi:hypothetical protein
MSFVSCCVTMETQHMNCCATVLIRYYGNATGCIGHVTKENPICHNIIKMIMNNNYIDTNTIHEIILINTILEQNYFQFDNKYYKQKEGLAMGAPTSGILSEICLQYIEHTHVSKILQSHNIIGYYRYVDDVLIIYNINKSILYIIYMILITLTRS